MHARPATSFQSQYPKSKRREKVCCGGHAILTGRTWWSEASLCSTAPHQHIITINEIRRGRQAGSRAGEGLPIQQSGLPSVAVITGNADKYHDGPGSRAAPIDRVPISCVLLFFSYRRVIIRRLLKFYLFSLVPGNSARQVPGGPLQAQFQLLPQPTGRGDCRIF